MSKLVKKEYTIEVSNGVNVQIDEKNVQNFIESCKGKKWTKVRGDWINTAYIVGVFSPQTINERNKRKAGRGTWTCDKHKQEIPYGKECGYCKI